LRAAGAAISLPFLDALLPRAGAAPSTFRHWAASPAAHPRFLACYIPNGVNIIEWMPKDAGPNYTLSPTLQTLKDHKADVTVFSQFGHPASQGGHSGADTWLTGANLKAVPGADYTNTRSADQILADVHGPQTRFASLQLSDMSGTGGAGHSHTLSFDANGTPLPAENSPRRLFERLFVPDTAGDRAAALKRYAERRSVLDDVLADAKRLEGKLGADDKRKLNEYLGSVRDTEKSVERMEKWIDVPKPKVAETGLQLVSLPMNGHDRPMWLDVMLELCYLAFITDTTRVITFEWSREAGGHGGGGENHHELSHHGGDAGMLSKLANIDRFHLSKLNRFLNMLKATTEAGATMLDSTVTLLGSGMNSGTGGEHSPKNLPTLLCGGKGLGIRHAGHVAGDEKKMTPLANVLSTAIRAVGPKDAKFGDATGAAI
jgi:hypothetical protein